MYIFNLQLLGNRNRLRKLQQSELFNSVWDFTKELFNAKPEAWSVDKIASLD